MLLSIDIEIMQLLLMTQESINHVNSGSVTPADIKQNNSKLQQAKKRLTELIELYESGKLETIKRQDAPLSIKLIPHTERIQIEKAQLAKDQKLRKLEKMMEQQPDGEEDENEDSISFEHDAGEIDELENYPPTSCYFECIFGLKEMYLYRGVFSCYLQKYADAVADFRKLQSSEPFQEDESMGRISFSNLSENSAYG
jgi:hypothetical protein